MATSDNDVNETPPREILAGLYRDFTANAAAICHLRQWLRRSTLQLLRARSLLRLLSLLRIILDLARLRGGSGHRLKEGATGMNLHLD